MFKFYSPYDGEDVSFVLWMSNGYGLQVDTYCRGTYLVSPAEFDSRNFHNPDGSPVTITGYVLRGSTNNSFEVYPNQQDYPVRPAADAVQHGERGADAAVYAVEDQDDAVSQRQRHPLLGVGGQPDPRPADAARPLKPDGCVTRARGR